MKMTSIGKLFAITALASLCAGLARGAEPDYPPGHEGFDHYYDWKLQPVRVDTTNAYYHKCGGHDFTDPMHGPWLTNPGETTMTVSFIGWNRTGAGIRYWPKGKRDQTKDVWLTTYGMVDFSKDVHHFHLTGLKPGTDYEYKLMTVSSKHVTACFRSVVGRATYSFRTLDTAKESYRVFVTSDLHGYASVVLDNAYDAAGGKDADLCFLLGDNVDDNMNEPRPYITRGFLDDVIRLWGREKPTVILRGNHDSWGLHAAEAWGEYFARPDQKAYYAFRHGPALFVALDTAAEPYFSRDKQPVSGEVASAYRDEQAAWLKALKETPLWKEAKFRIVMNHYGTRTDAYGSGFFFQTGKLLKPILNDTTPEGRIHLFLCGDEHRYARVNANSAEVVQSPDDKPLTFKDPKRKAYPQVVDTSWNFTEVCCTCRGEGLSLDVSPEKLTVTSYRVKNGRGGILDRVEIGPDGQVIK